VSAYVPAPKLQANQTGGRTRSGDRSLLGLETTSRLQAVDTSISPGNPVNNYSRASIL